MHISIPDPQRERIQPVLEALLAELHQRTQALTSEIDMPLDFDPQAGE